jgi:DNA gyrase/topoisomerase IV subunit B
MSEIDTIRQNSGMYIGSTETATRLLEESMDNSFDELQAGFCTIIGVFVDTKEKTFKVLDNARGFPFDQKLPIENDPPVMSCTQMHTSGKFKKGDEDSPYKIASGLHGIGLTAVNALSDWVEIEIYRDKTHAIYKFENGKLSSRTQEIFKGSKPFSTKIFAKPSSKYFEDPGVNLKVIEERLRMVCANYPELSIVFRVDDKDIVISGTVDDLILSYLTKTENLQWLPITIKKGDEQLSLRLAWDEEPPLAPKILSCVNLVRVFDGVHITKLQNSLKEVFAVLAKKYKYNFDPKDCFIGLRGYIDLKLIRTSFEAQVKVKLETKTDLSVMDNLESMIKKFLESNDEFRTLLLDRFQAYRNKIHSKKIVGEEKKRRTSGGFTKLRDCKFRNGELIIGEGDSAIGGLINERDEKTQALLPLRGVIPNALTMKRDHLLANPEVKYIMNAVGTGFGEHCDISNIRYKQIIIATDADPAGHWIASLLIILFAVLTPEIIKGGFLYVCKTPLFGVRRSGKFVPLWNIDDIENAKTKNEKIMRFKGLGEFNPEDLRVFTLEETRILTQIKWSEKYEKIFELFVSSEKKRELVAGEWKL